MFNVMNVKNSLGKNVLLAIEKSIEGYLVVEDFLYNPHSYLYGYPRNYSRSRVLQAVKRLRKQGLVDLIDGEKLIMKLTDEGLNFRIKEKIKTSDEKWDGKWRLVVFDIPEKRRAARDLLRIRLKDWGFRQLQKSIWISKKNCTEVLRKFVSNLGVGEWVMVIESDNIGLDTLK